ncbi:uncharacterized protein SPPG_06581 [Spizellomyces punctatus DAOM BR117]|uniref:C2H2-type domain-containing protein n=1 Tax=Spizellomyces punctatus (strain DAOM BR117) TaxID=645134 RepID=A0A0L0HAJ2_SPIPD|nr:uncharacterized protein SPPG_06581 [Spizellomyces punctatus DAOM BR117]KNC98177.1 hypothetical protein SPPG_06581 [Spizellomyces punctatus DAOM BR117]|eukprot:XP_016606217.1 hypothetical protein SPPG_06581 [Spizellomyces punctatus DAOM BR117]
MSQSPTSTRSPTPPAQSPKMLIASLLNPINSIHLPPIEPLLHSNRRNSLPARLSVTQKVERRRASSLPRRRYVCEVEGCGKNFSTSGHLSRHRRLHTGSKPHACPIPTCSSRFSRHDNMLQHYRGHVRKLEKASTKALPRGRRASAPDVGKEESVKSFVMHLERLV